MMYGTEFAALDDNQKINAIKHVLNLKFHNGISKETIIEMLRYVVAHSVTHITIKGGA